MWYWKVRMYRDDGCYYCASVETGRDLSEISVILRTYEDMTGCRMLLEGMKETPYDDGTPSLRYAFSSCWRRGA